MASTWMGDHSSVEVDAVVKKSVQFQERRNGGPQIHVSGAKKFIANDIMLSHQQKNAPNSTKA